MKNLDSIVNQILAEAFLEVGDTSASAPGGPINQRGGVERQMLAGEMVSSPAFFTQPPRDGLHQPLSALLDAQSKKGLGEKVDIGGAVNSFVEAYLQDTAVEMFTNPNNVDYLINSLRESGYTEYASAVDAITMNPTVDDVAKINEMVKNLEKDPKNSYFVESLIYLAEQIVDEDEEETEANAEEEEPKEEE